MWVFRQGLNSRECRSFRVIYQRAKFYGVKFQKSGAVNAIPFVLVHITLYCGRKSIKHASACLFAGVPNIIFLLRCAKSATGAQLSRNTHTLPLPIPSGSLL